MALVHIEFTDPWIAEYDACEKLFREIMEQLTARNEQPKASQAYASLSANIRIRLKQYTRQVRELRGKVVDATKLMEITSREAERRTRQIEFLESREVQLQKLYDARTTEVASSRANLFRSGGSAFADGGTTSWAADDDDDDEQPIDVRVPISELVSHQDRVLLEQDKGLEELRKVIARQMEIGQTISNEVEHHHEIIDDLADHIDTTDDKLVNRTRQIETISAKDRTCGYWVVILLLFVAIVAVALV